MPTFIQIIKPTAGEAPSWIREAWVGRVMPVVTHDPSPKAVMHGLLSGKEVGPTDGYVVRWEDAMEALESRPSALEWFQSQPELRTRYGWLVFSFGNCIEVEAPVMHDHEHASLPQEAGPLIDARRPQAS